MAGILVTGASSGIGRACVMRLARRDLTVFAGVRSDADGEDLESEAQGRVVAVRLDVTDEAQVREAAERVGSVLGDTPLRAVVNNAGIAVGGPVEYLPLDVWREQFEVNLFGVVAVTQAFAERLRASAGRIVIIGSVSGRVANPMTAPYAASKHAVEALGEALRHELRPWGIRTTVVEPGAVRTPIWEKGRAFADRLERQLPAAALERYAKPIGMVRRGIDFQESNGVEPDRVAATVERSIFGARPRARALVGIDARLFAAVDRVLPDGARDLLMRQLGDRI
jgi:NAD(P)-dependent dehydrogenase (short-subunit alcohol dehydrogenase family)